MRPTVPATLFASALALAGLTGVVTPARAQAPAMPRPVPSPAPRATAPAVPRDASVSRSATIPRAAAAAPVEAVPPRAAVPVTQAPRASRVVNPDPYWGPAQPKRKLSVFGRLREAVLNPGERDHSEWTPPSRDVTTGRSTPGSWKPWMGQSR